MLATRRGSVAIGKQIGRGQRLGVPQVSIEGMNEGSAFLDDPHAGVMMSVNSPLVRFGITKPALQVEIVLRHFGGISPCEEPGLKASQHLGHLLPDGVGTGLQLVTQVTEPRFARDAVAVLGVEHLGNRADHLDVALNHRQIRSDRFQPALDTARQTP